MDIYDLADKIMAALESRPDEWVTPSVAGRRARLTTAQAQDALSYLATERYVDTSGNGAWTRFRPRRSSLNA